MHYFWLGFGPSSSLYRSRSSCRCAASRLLETLAFLALALATGPAGTADLDYPSSPPPAYSYEPSPPPAYSYEPPPPAYAYRPPGAPPAVVYYTPNPRPASFYARKAKSRI
jgi:hypothetical protein